jgi:hypothetical protein
MHKYIVLLLQVNLKEWTNLYTGEKMFKNMKPKIENIYPLIYFRAQNMTLGTALKADPDNRAVWGLAMGAAWLLGSLDRIQLTAWIFDSCFFYIFVQCIPVVLIILVQ